MSDAEDRTIPATQRRRRMAKHGGMIPGAALPAWGASAAVTVLLLPAWWRTTTVAAVRVLRGACVPGAGFEPWEAIPLILPTAAMVLAAAVASVAVRVVIDGAELVPSRLLPDARRLAPLGGLNRIVSWRTLSTALAGAAWMAAIAAVAWYSAGRPLLELVGRALDTLPVGAPPGMVLSHAATIIGESLGLLVPTLAAACTVATVRWALLRLRAERRIRMTPEEARQEMRDQATPSGRGHGRTGAAAVPPAPVGQVAAGGA